MVSYLPYVRALALQCFRARSRTAAHAIELDDCVSAGTLGLLDAVMRYNLDQGCAFPSYAYWFIRGAILDEIRAPEGPRRKSADTSASGSAEACTPRMPLGVSSSGQVAFSPAQVDKVASSPAERARAESAGGVAPSDVVAPRKRAAITLAPSGAGSVLRQPMPLDDLTEEPADLNAVPIDQALVLDEDIDAVRAAVGTLPERQRCVLVMSFVEGRTYAEIGAHLGGVTEGRVSQLRSQALKTLRRILLSRERGTAKARRQAA